jgi:hypothetical protein
VTEGDVYPALGLGSFVPLSLAEALEDRSGMTELAASPAEEPDAPPGGTTALGTVLAAGRPNLWRCSPDSGAWGRGDRASARGRLLGRGIQEGASGVRSSSTGPSGLTPFASGTLRFALGAMTSLRCRLPSGSVWVPWARAPSHGPVFRNDP